MLLVATTALSGTGSSHTATLLVKLMAARLAAITLRLISALSSSSLTFVFASIVLPLAATGLVSHITGCTWWLVGHSTRLQLPTHLIRLHIGWVWAAYRWCLRRNRSRCVIIVNGMRFLLTIHALALIMMARIIIWGWRLCSHVLSLLLRIIVIVIFLFLLAAATVVHILLMITILLIIRDAIISCSMIILWMSFWVPIAATLIFVLVVAGHAALTVTALLLLVNGLEWFNRFEKNSLELIILVKLGGQIASCILVFVRILSLILTGISVSTVLRQSLFQQDVAKVITQVMWQLLTVKTFSYGLSLIQRIAWQMLQSFKRILTFEDPIYFKVWQKHQVWLVVHLVVRVFGRLIVVAIFSLKTHIWLNFLRRFGFHARDSLNTARFINWENEDDIFNAVKSLRQFHGWTSRRGPNALLHTELKILHRVRLDNKESCSFFKHCFLLVHHLEGLILPLIMTALNMWTWLGCALTGIYTAFKIVLASDLWIDVTPVVIKITERDHWLI